jgi:hypothetical protein
MNKKARVIAFYLPQFHPIPENDEWWGKGFTEWTNVGKAKPLFRGHYQPRIPADLGYYDLRMPEVREAQAQMAREAGIEGFMYWHYWFGNGKTLLERPFNEVLNSGKPDFPFCLGWANHSWENKTWSPDGQYKRSKMLIEQLYPGVNDYKEHFFYVLDAFKDKRYIQVDGKPLFLIYSPLEFKDVKSFISLWQKLSKENGLNGIYFVGQTYLNYSCLEMFELGFNGICRAGVADAINKIHNKYIHKIILQLHRFQKFTSIAPLRKYRYSDIIKNLIVPHLDKTEHIHPTILPNFDHSPRSGNKGIIFTHSTPALFKKLLREAMQIIASKEDRHKIIFLRSWNEWAEGNYVEPDLKFGHDYLDVIKKELL